MYFEVLQLTHNSQIFCAMKSIIFSPKSVFHVTGQEPSYWNILYYSLGQKYVPLIVKDLRQVPFSTHTPFSWLYEIIKTWRCGMSKAFQYLNLKKK